METILRPEYLEFNRLYKEESDIYREISLKMGTPNSAISILYDLSLLGGGCTQKDICESSFLSKQTVNSAIKKLLADGHIYLEKGLSLIHIYRPNDAYLRIAKFFYQYRKKQVHRNACK